MLPYTWSDPMQNNTRSPPRSPPGSSYSRSPPNTSPVGSPPVPAASSRPFRADAQPFTRQRVTHGQNLQGIVATTGGVQQGSEDDERTLKVIMCSLTGRHDSLPPHNTITGIDMRYSTFVTSR